MSKKDVVKMLKCVMCGSIEDLKPFTHSSKMSVGHKRTSSGSTTQYVSWGYEFPVCNLCLRKDKIKNGILIISGITFFIALCFLIYGGLMTFFTPSQAYLLIIGITLAVISILGVIVGFTFPNPKKYMDVFFGEPKVKPKKLGDWVPFSIWAEKVLKERIIQGTVDPTPLIKKAEEALNSKKEQQIRKRDETIEMKKKITSCPKCGNLVNRSEKQICEVCGNEFK